MEAKNSRLYQSLFDEIGLAKKDIIQFSMGAPSLNILAKLRPLFCEATKKRMENDKSSGDMFQYGALRGDPVFVEALPKFLSEHYKEHVNSDDIVCTGGATQGAYILASLLLKTGDYIFVEDLTYFINLKVFQNDLKMNIVTVPMDDDGVNIDAFDKILTEYHDKLGPTNDGRPYRAIFYTIPVFHNPTGILYSTEKCTALIKVLRKHDILALCDDVYNIIHFEDGPPPQRLFSYDKKTDVDYKGHVVSNGTFSKIVGPGMRLGWLEAPKIVVDKVINSSLLKSGGGLNQYTSAIMGAALQHGILSGYIMELIEIYKTRMEAMCQAIDKYLLPFIMPYRKPKGGYFIWIELQNNCDATAFQKYCLAQHKVDFRPGPRFSLEGNFQNCIRLSFAYTDVDEIYKGIKEIAIALQKFLNQ